MAQVPDPGAPPSVTPDGIADSSIRVASSPEVFGGGVAQGVSQLGQGVGQAGDATARIALTDADIANTATVNARFNALQQKAQTLASGDGANVNPGFFGTRGQQTMSSYDGTVQQLLATRDQLAQGLPPAAANQFEFASRRFVDGQLSSYSQHLEQQRRVYADQTAEATAATDIQSAILYRDDPDKFGAALSDMRSTIIQNETAKGSSPAVINQAVADRTSKLYAGVVQAKAETDPDGAYSFYQQHQDLLTGPDQVMVEARLKPLLYQWNSRTDADNIMSGATGGVAAGVAAEAEKQGVDAGLALTTAKIESGMGSRLSSPTSSASGVFGMVPSTWAANGGTAANRGDVPTQISLGVKNLASSQQVANAAVGGTAEPWQAYLVHQQGAGGGAALLKADAGENVVAALTPAYGGNATMAARAVTGNGGSANMTVGQFRDLWQSTYQHVASTVSVPAPGTSPGTPTSTNPRDHAADWLAQGSGVLSPLGTNDPVYQDMVQSRIRAKIGEIEYAQGQQDRATQNTLLSAALGLTPATPAAPPATPPVPGQPVTAAVNAPAPGQPAPPPSTGPGIGAAVASVGGSAPTARPTSIDQLLAISPAVKAAWMNATPEVQRGILGMIEKNATEGPPITPAAQTQYYRLLSESTSQPDSFLRENLADPDLLATMPRGMLTSLMNRQASIDSKAAEQQARIVTLTHARAVVAPDLAAAGINPRAAQMPNAPQAVRDAYAQFDGRLDEALEQFRQDNNGARPTDAQIKAIGQTLLTPGTIAGTGHLWGLIGPTQQKLFQSQAAGTTGQFVPSVPANDRAQIIAAYAGLHGGAKPSEGEIATYYMAGRSRMPAAEPTARPRMGGGAPSLRMPRQTASATPAATTPNPFGDDEDNDQ